MSLTILIVAIFAVVQSMFGIGLLVFGTPTFLLLGHSFVETLAILLPASITVSLLQVWKDPRQDAAFVRLFARWCLVPLAVTLVAVLYWKQKSSLNLAIAVLLSAFAVLRTFPKLGRKASDWVIGRERIWLATMGLVHGLSNLGGSMLMIFAVSKCRRKEDIRAMIAFCYVCFASIQLGTLAILTPQAFGWNQFCYAAVAGAAYLLVGRRVFGWVSAPAFDRLLTLFAAAYAGLLALRSASVF